MSLAGIVLATLLVSAFGGLVPFVNVELWLVGVSATCPTAALWPVVLAASLGQVAAKALLYLGGDAAVPCLRRRLPRAWAGLSAFEARRSLGTTMVFGSALLGLPPLYVVSVVAGVARFPFARFLALTLAGRILRFAVVFVLPRVIYDFAPGWTWATSPGR